MAGGIGEERKLNPEGGSPLSKKQLPSNIIKAQQCNNCQLVTENNKIHISVSLSQMPTRGSNSDPANPPVFNREITAELRCRPGCLHCFSLVPLSEAPL